MAKEKDKALEESPVKTEALNAPSDEQVSNTAPHPNESAPEKEEDVIDKEQEKRTGEDQEKEKEQPIESVSIEMGFKEEDTAPHPNDVSFKVHYTKSFSGKKTFKDGDVLIVSKETADLFKSRGIGKVL